jgi:hypothetical protein
MDRVLAVVLTVLTLAAWPARTASAQSEADLGPLVDLTGGSVSELPRLGSWLGRRPTDLYLCADGETAPLLGTFRIGALILTRDRATVHPSSKIFAADGAVLADSAELGLGTAAGIDVMLLAPLSQSNELEIRYFGINGWNASRTVGDPDGVLLDGFGVTAAGLTERMDYASRLYSFEINARPRVVDGIPLVLGFRTLQLHEQFDAWRLTPGLAAVALDTRARNYLYGFQIGAEPYLFGNGSALRLDGLLKAGIYGNHAVEDAVSAIDGTTISAVHNRASFVGELGLTVVYRFSQMFEARAGYELLWLKGIALAPDQGATTNLLVPAAVLNNSSSALYQGGMVSLGFVF